MSLQTCDFCLCEWLYCAVGITVDQVTGALRHGRGVTSVPPAAPSSGAAGISQSGHSISTGQSTQPRSTSAASTTGSSATTGGSSVTQHLQSIGRKPGDATAPATRRETQLGASTSSAEPRAGSGSHRETLPLDSGTSSNPTTSSSTRAGLGLLVPSSRPETDAKGLN